MVEPAPQVPSATFLSVLRCLIAGLAVAVGGAFVYDAAVVYSPLIYLSLLLTVGYGMVIGYAVFAAARQAKMRHVLLARIIAAASMAPGMYVAWAVDRWVRANRYGAQVHLSFDPAVIERYMKVFYDNGFWSINHFGSSSVAVSGIPLFAVWVVEAGFVFLTAWNTAGDGLPRRSA